MKPDKDATVGAQSKAQQPDDDPSELWWLDPLLRPNTYDQGFQTGGEPPSSFAHTLSSQSNASHHDNPVPYSHQGSYTPFSFAEDSATSIPSQASSFTTEDSSNQSAPSGVNFATTSNIQSSSSRLVQAPSSNAQLSRPTVTGPRPRYSDDDINTINAMVRAGSSFEEIAQVLGRNPSDVKTKYKRLHGKYDDPHASDKRKKHDRDNDRDHDRARKRRRGGGPRGGQGGGQGGAGGICC